MGTATGAALAPRTKRAKATKSTPAATEPKVKKGAAKAATPAPQVRAAKRTPKRFTASLADVVAAGLLRAGHVLYGKYNKETVQATVRKDGTVGSPQYKGESFKSLSALAQKFVGERMPEGTKGASINGWRFFSYKDADGKFVSVGTLRDSVTAEALAEVADAADADEADEAETDELSESAADEGDAGSETDEG